MVSVTFLTVCCQFDGSFSCRRCGGNFLRVDNLVSFCNCRCQVVVLKFETTYLQCDKMTDLMLGKHGQLSFSVCLLKILWSGWFFGEHLSMMCRNFLQRLVLTFELKEGLYHVMFLVRFLLFFRAFSCGGFCVNLWSYLLSVRAFW